MAITRATLLRRALVGGAVVVFGKLPDQLAEIPAVPNDYPEIARTAIPTSARMVDWEAVRAHKDRWEQMVWYGPRESGEWVTDENWMRTPNIVALTAQRQRRLTPIKGHAPVVAPTATAAILGPGDGHFFKPDDILRASGTGDLYLVGPKIERDVLTLVHVGHSDYDSPIISPEKELQALAKLLPPERQHGSPASDNERARNSFPARSSIAQRHGYTSFGEFSQSAEGRRLGYGDW